MDDEMPTLRAYLRACKDTLEDLMLLLYQKTTNREDFDFSSHSALRTLYLSSNGKKPMKVLHDILSTVLSTTSSSQRQVERILLQTPRWQLENDGDAWESLDTLFSSYVAATKMQPLQISPVVDAGEMFEGSEGMVIQRFPKLSEPTTFESTFPFPKRTGDRFNAMQQTDEVVMSYVDEVYGRMKLF